MNAGLFARNRGKAGKLTLDQVGEIRRYYAEGATQGALARHYGVAIGTIGRIVRGESWAGQVRVGQGTQAELDASKARLALMLGAAGVEEMMEKSPLPKAPNRKKIDALCQEMVCRHLGI